MPPSFKSPKGYWLPRAQVLALPLLTPAQGWAHRGSMSGCPECHPEGRKPWPRPPCPLQGLALSARAQGICKASARHQIRQELKTGKFSPERWDTRGEPALQLLPWPCATPPLS